MAIPHIRPEWAKYFNFFNEQNRGRPTRLGVFEKDGDSLIDYWLESGLLFTGVNIASSGDGALVHILIGEVAHVVTEPQQIKFILSRQGDEDGIDVTDSQGRTTVLRFEGIKTD